MALKMKTEFRIGLLVTVAIAFLILGYNFLRGRGFFSNEDQYYVYYDNVSGLQKSAMVTFEGVQVGKVIGIALQDDRRIKVTIGMTDKTFPIPAGSKAQLNSDNLLAGTKNITLILGESNKNLRPGDTLEAIGSAGMFDNISAEMGPLVKSLHHTIGTVDTLIKSVNMIINTQARAHLESSFNSLDEALVELAALSKSLNQQTGNLNAVMNNLNSVSGNLAANNEQVSAILNNAETATAKISNAKIQESFDNIEAATKSLQQTLHRIEASDGSMGLLIRDRQLYDNLNRSLSALDTLLTDVKKRPSRYINVSVFGRKAAE